MADMFVSPLVSMLIENLASSALSFIPSGDIHRKLEEWTTMLQMIQAVLEDAEDRQFNENDIKLWLKKVQKLAFEIDDVVDDLLIEAGRRQMIATPESSISGKLRKIFSIFSPRAIRFGYDLDRKIGEISDSLKELEERKIFMKLQEYVGGKSEKPGYQKLPSTSLPDRVYGRDEESSAILKLLLEDKASDHYDQVRVISIVGMGGIGKTTLAQFLYHNEGVKDSFHNRAWVSVTQDFDVLKISKIIYEEVSDESCSFNELNKVLVKLMENLSKEKKMFLLVLDDVWNEDGEKWDLLCKPFRYGAPGSTIIVTTRSQNVANIMGSKEVYDLKGLSDGDCLSLLAQHALTNFNERPDFKEVAEKIAKRCKGLPLAAKSLGGLLRTKKSLKQWEKVTKSKIWELQSNKIIPALRLSYHHLPPYLKPLFVYCSLFPKGYEFNKQELIMLWMSQGFLKESSGEQEQMEELGSEYFDELLSRSFFQISTGNKSRYLMHDLNNDLAQFVAGLTYLCLDDKMVSNEQYKVSEETRHVSFMSHLYADFKTFKALNAARCLRTILPIRMSYPFHSYLSSLVFKDFPKLLCLRALSFNGYNISEVPKSIGDLNHLRYLDFSRTDITDLPESVCDLYNLQTLLLHDCRKLVQLPSNIHKLINLRHLDIVNTTSLKEMPLGIGLLNHLRTLSKFIIGKGDGQNITELKGLHHLQGAISIIGIEKVMNVQDAMEANLLCKEGLHGLEMNWSNNFGGTREGRLELEVLEALKPQTGLASLEIEFFGGQKFPSWVGDHSFCDMVKVRLIGCKNCTYLPPLGQLTSLKELCIEGMDGVKVVGPEFLGSCSPHIVAFQSLIDLSFRYMRGWEEWCVDENIGAFPSLQKLEMSWCRKLKKVSLPKIPSLVSLELRDCGEMILRSMVGVGSVKKLNINDISGLSKLDEGIIECLGGVEDLFVWGCKELRYLWEEEVACQILRKLKSLSVLFCRELELLGDEEQLLPHNLESLELEYCNKLEKMPNWQNNLTSLRRLTINGCEKLEDSLVSTTYLEVKIEKKGKSSRSDRRLGEYEFSNLENVRIEGCPSLKWLPMGKKLPTTLRHLSIRYCENLKEVDEEGEKLWVSLSLLESISFYRWSNIKSIPQGLTHLTHLEIYYCQSIETIPEKSLPPTLKSLTIWNCSNLKNMLCANEMQSLTSLRRLEINGCKNMEGYPSVGGRCWPPNLVLLEMGEVKQPIKEWGLATLPTSLLTLGLSGEFPLLISFSEVETQLPSSLTRLQIWYPKNLESLGEGLQNLSSLQHLDIRNCSKLRNLPETLLPTLSSLQIEECPLLEERCKKEKRDYWPKISHIPRVEINEQLMWGL